MRRTAAAVLAAVLALVVGGYLARDLLAREVVELAAERQTGFPLRIGAVHLDLLGGRVELRGVELMNPPEFEERRFVSLPLVRASYDTASLLRREPHLAELTVHVDEVFVVTDAGGEKNTARLASAAGGRAGSAQKTKAMPYRIDVLHVRVGKVVLKDFSRGRRTERTIRLDLDRTYRNVTASTSMSGLVLGSVFQSLGPVVGDVAKGLGGALEGAGSGAGKVGKGLLDLLRRPSR